MSKKSNQNLNLGAGFESDSDSEADVIARYHELGDECAEREKKLKFKAKMMKHIFALIRLSPNNLKGIIAALKGAHAKWQQEKEIKRQNTLKTKRATKEATLWMLQEKEVHFEQVQKLKDHPEKLAAYLAQYEELQKTKASLESIRLGTGPLALAVASSSAGAAAASSSSSSSAAFLKPDDSKNVEEEEADLDIDVDIDVDEPATKKMKFL